MSLSAHSSSFARLSPTESPAPVSWSKSDHPEVLPADLVIFSSMTDWEDPCERLQAHAERAGVNAEVIFFETLFDDDAEVFPTLADRLFHLHKTIGDWLDSGKLPPSALSYVSLHGGSSEEFSTLSEYFDAEPEMKDFFDTLLGQSEAQDAALAEELERSPLYIVSCCGREIPAVLIDAALRHAPSSRSAHAQSFKGPIAWGACGARNLAPSLRACGGENLLLSGKKSVLSGDTDACVLEAIDLMGARKRDAQPPLTGRDYWMHFRNVSGEHIAYVRDDAIEIHKVLESGHTEPSLTSRSERVADQPRRVLQAKLMHGSAKALQSVFDKYGKDAFSATPDQDIFWALALDRENPETECQKKLAVLEKNGFSMTDHAEKMQTVLECCIEASNARLLSAVLQSLQKKAGGASLREMMDAFVQPENDSLVRDLRDMLADDSDIAQLWFALTQQARPPEIRQAIERALEGCSDEDDRTEREIRLSLANADVCLANLLRNALERHPDPAEAEALLPHVRGFPEDSLVMTYLSVLLLQRGLRSSSGKPELETLLEKQGLQITAEPNPFTPSSQRIELTHWIF